MLAGYSLIQLVILLIIVCGVVGILIVVMRQTGVSVPQWVIQIAWICLVCFVAILAIKFLMSL